MKIQCSCGAKYALDVTPEMAWSPFKFVCPQCGLDSSDFVNQLIQQELAEQKSLPPVPPPPTTPVEPPKPAPVRLKISHAEKPPEPPTETATPETTPAVSKFCPKHPRVLATEKCATCGKPICPKCLEIFGYFCSPFCQNKAEQHGRAAPVYAGNRFAAEKKFWRKTGLISGFIFAVVILALGFWIWYAWFGSVPHTYFSVPFADDSRAYAGGAQLVGQTNLVFLHGGTLARYDLKSKTKIWSQEIIPSDQITAITKQMDDARTRANQQVTDGEYIGAPLPGVEEREAKIVLQNQLTLRVAGQDVWVAAPDKLTHYDWNTGKILTETALPELVGAENNFGGGLFSSDGQPLDPNKVAAQAQNLNLPARIALPALLGNAAYEQKLEAALHDDDSHPRAQTSKPFQGAAGNFTLVSSENGFVQFDVKLLQANVVTREAMRAPAGKSALDNPNLNDSQTTEVANETLNEMQRNNGGDKVTEDDSRYQVTVRLPNSPGVSNWTGEVTGPPQLFALKTVNVIAAGKTIIVLDPANKKLWDATLTYNVSGNGENASGGKSSFGAGPCVEHGNTLYVFDQAVLSAFDLATGNSRWRVPSIGIVGLFFDGQNNLYVNTTTGNPDDIKYARQIDIAKATTAELLKIEPATGKILWRAKPGGFISYLSGNFIYAVESYDPNPTDKEVLNDSLVGLEKPPYLHISRLDPQNGRVLWDYVQDRCPVAVRFENNFIELIFKREVQVLKFLML